MPRKPPGSPGVLEHRITFGDYERAQFKEAVEAYNRDKWLENVPYIGISVAAGAAAVGILYAGYGLYKWFDLPSLVDEAKQAVQNFDRFMRPYAYSDLANTHTGKRGAIGRVDEFIPYTYRYNTKNDTQWAIDKPYCITTAQEEFDEKIALYQGQLEAAQIWAQSDNFARRAMGKVLLEKLPKEIEALENRREYVTWAIENVVWLHGQTPGWSLAPNTWNDGYNYPPPAI